MPQLKTITRAGIPAALQKAERYRFLSDSSAAESICLDVLAVDPENQAAVVLLLLSITDQIEYELAKGVQRSRELLDRITDDYQRAYYAGIICEREAKALLHRDAPGARHVVAEWLRDAMSCYEKAEAIGAGDNDSAILRWNTCARLLAKHEVVEAAPMAYEPALED
jgi:hypothetical protein